MSGIFQRQSGAILATISDGESAGVPVLRADACVGVLRSAHLHARDAPARIP